MYSASPAAASQAVAADAADSGGGRPCASPWAPTMICGAAERHAVRELHSGDVGQPMMRSCVLLLCLSVITGCGRYATHQEPGCPPPRAHTRFAEDRSRSGVIAGAVRDRDTGRPIGEARVQVTPTSRSTTSDSAGAFSIAGLPPGQHVVSVLRIGYESRTDTVTTRARRSVLSQIALTPAYVDRCMEIVEVRTPLPWWRFW